MTVDLHIYNQMGQLEGILNATSTNMYRFARWMESEASRLADMCRADVLKDEAAANETEDLEYKAWLLNRAMNTAAYGRELTAQAEAWANIQKDGYKVPLYDLINGIACFIGSDEQFDGYLKTLVNEGMRVLHTQGNPDCVIS